MGTAILRRPQVRGSCTARGRRCQSQQCRICAVTLITSAGTAPARYWKEKGHQTSGGLSLSRSEGPIAPFCEKGALHNPNERSHSLIQVKIHSATSVAQTAKPSAPPTLDGFAFVPIRAVFLDSIRLDIEPGSEASAADASPSLVCSPKRDAPQSDKESIAPVRARRCDLSATLLTNFIFCRECH